jgi:hypothetical protein
MGWGGIANLPPGFDVFGGQKVTPNIIDEALGGRVKGLMAAQESHFADLKRNLLHQDYARYFDSCLLCAGLLERIEDGRYRPEVLKDIIEPALAKAVEQMESIRTDAVRAHDAKRKMAYDPLPTLDHFLLKARPLADAYPQATGARDLTIRYEEIVRSVRALDGP